MIPFDLIRAESLDEALECLSSNARETKIIAGGTDLLVGLRGLSPGDKGPAAVLDITPIEELRSSSQFGAFMKMSSRVFVTITRGGTATVTHLV